MGDHPWVQIPPPPPFIQPKRPSERMAFLRLNSFFYSACDRASHLYPRIFRHLTKACCLPAYFAQCSLSDHHRTTKRIDHLRRPQSSHWSVGISSRWLLSNNSDTFCCVMQEGAEGCWPPVRGRIMANVAKPNICRGHDWSMVERLRFSVAFHYKNYDSIA